MSTNHDRLKDYSGELAMSIVMLATNKAAKGEAPTGTTPAPTVEYEDPADELRQALTVLLLECEAPDPDMGAIKEAAKRIESVCARGIRWRK